MNEVTTVTVGVRIGRMAAEREFTVTDCSDLAVRKVVELATPDLVGALAGCQAWNDPQPNAILIRSAELKCADLNDLLKQLGSKVRVGVFVNAETSPPSVDVAVTD